MQGQLNNALSEIALCHHTLSSIIADTEGNVVSGKHPINSNWWGSGLFVQGVLLNSSGDITSRYTGPGQRRTQGAPNFLVFKDGPLRYACGTWGSSNPQTAFQFLVNLLDYGLPADQAADLPRFGGFPFDEATWTVDYTKNELEEGISKEIENILNGRGLYFKRIRRVGTGCIAEFNPDGTTTTGWD